MGGRISMSISVDSPLGETLNRGPPGAALAVTVWISLCDCYSAIFKFKLFNFQYPDDMTYKYTEYSFVD